MKKVTPAIYMIFYGDLLMPWRRRIYRDSCFNDTSLGVRLPGTEGHIDFPGP